MPSRKVPARCGSQHLSTVNRSSIGLISMHLCPCSMMRVVFFICSVMMVSELSLAQGQQSGYGSWEVLTYNSGIASMHTAVTHYGTVIMLDRTNIGPSNINLSQGLCRDNPYDLTLTHDCAAHSVLFTPGPNTVRPLFIYTDTWCSSGQFMADGSLVQTGGDNDGLMKVRRFSPCGDDSCDWVELSDEALQDGRWYATNQLLPDGRQIVIGGRSVFTYEFIPSNGIPKTFLPFLNQTSDEQNDNYYPFVHLLPDGTLYIFANRDSIIYDYEREMVVKSFPTIPGEPRNYPSAGSSVMLPLNGNDSYESVEVLVCGGAQMYCFLYPDPYPDASQTCGRITVTSSEPQWEMDYMPFRRAMGDMLFLPTGDVLIINGAQNGCQGWGNAINPTLNPIVYDSSAPLGNRFTTKAATQIPRMYHSTANLLPDGRVLVAGSNSHQFYTYTGGFPTELRVEAFSPEYMDSTNDERRPWITSSPERVEYGQQFSVYVYVNGSIWEMGMNMVSSPFTTHSYAQGLRFLRVKVDSQGELGGGYVQLNATAPPSPTVAPPSYYMLFVVNQGIPSKATWVQMVYPSS